MTLEAGDVAAVRQLMERYTEATFRADVDVLRSAFHEQAWMVGYLGPDLMLGGPEPFFQDVGSRPSMAQEETPFKAEITSIAVSGRIAAVCLEEWEFFGAVRFTNYFTLLKIGGEWKIITKTFASL